MARKPQFRRHYKTSKPWDPTVPEEVALDPKITGNEMRLFVFLRWRFRNDRECWPDIEEIIFYTGWKRRKVIYTLKALEERGLIGKRRLGKTRRDGSRTNLYIDLTRRPALNSSKEPTASNSKHSPVRDENACVEGLFGAPPRSANGGTPEVQERAHPEVQERAHPLRDFDD